MNKKRYIIRFKTNGGNFTQIEYSKTECLKTVSEMLKDKIVSIKIDVEPQ